MPTNPNRHEPASGGTAVAYPKAKRQKAKKGKQAEIEFDDKAGRDPVVSYTRLR